MVITSKQTLILNHSFLDSGVARTGADASAKDLQMETNAVEIQSVWFLMWSISEKKSNEI